MEHYDVCLELRVASGGENSGRRVTIRQHEGSTMHADCRVELQRSRKNAMVIVLRSHRKDDTNTTSAATTVIFFQTVPCYRRTGTIRHNTRDDL